MTSLGVSMHQGHHKMLRALVALIQEEKKY
jgi:hypothetical protein